jgi:N-acetylglutamate synthase-like GNAT family acetyltransferase
MIKIIQYGTERQEDIESLVDEISREFDESITPSNSSYKKNIDQLWLADKDDSLVGTIGLIRLKNNNAILKSMFVKTGFRGKSKGVSTLLLQTAFNWSKDEKIERLFLGTMTQFKAAQNFYAKNGFVRIDRKQLPSDFIDNPFDSRFYRRDLIYKLPPKRNKSNASRKLKSTVFIPNVVGHSINCEFEIEGEINMVAPILKL